MSDILEQLPDSRATQRLISALDRLERTIKADRKGTDAAQAATLELKNLREENLSLRFRQKKARERLDKLLVKLPGLFPELTETANEAQAA